MKPLSDGIKRALSHSNDIVRRSVTCEADPCHTELALLVAAEHGISRRVQDSRDVLMVTIEVLGACQQVIHVENEEVVETKIATGYP